MKSKYMKELYAMWKWKLLMVEIVILFFILPIILNWYEVGFTSLILSYFIALILTCITIITCLNYDVEPFEENDIIDNRYATKTINPDSYSTIKVNNDGNTQIRYTKEVEFPSSLLNDNTPEMETLSKDGPYLLGHINFLDIKVPVYYEKYIDDKEKVIAVWQYRNPDLFYTGPVIMNWESGKIEYPDGVIPPEPKHEDYEMLPKFVAVGFEELTIENKNVALNYFAKEYTRRNKNWLENEK